jgi:hypothetical protein
MSWFILNHLSVENFPTASYKLSGSFAQSLSCCLAFIPVQFIHCHLANVIVGGLVIFQ